MGRRSPARAVQLTLSELLGDPRPHGLGPGELEHALDGRERAPGGALLARPVGSGSLVVTLDSSNLGEETVATAMELLTPLQRLLARASEP